MTSMIKELLEQKPVLNNNKGKEELTITEMLRWLEDKERILQDNIKTCKEEIRRPSKNNFYIDAAMGSHVGALMIYNETLSMIRGIKRELEEKAKTQKDTPTPILADEERTYLKNVIQPFKDQCTWVTKFEHPYTCEEYIDIQLKTFIITLPILERGKIYKGMELNKKYTLKELNIKYE